MTISETALTQEYASLRPHLNERSLRFCAATDAHLLGHGGISMVARAAGVSRTTIHAGLEIKAALDKCSYNSGIKVSDRELENINLYREEFHGEWNYEIRPIIDAALYM